MTRIMKCLAAVAVAALVVCAGETRGGVPPVYSAVYGNVVDSNGVPVGRARVRLCARPVLALSRR